MNSILNYTKDELVSLLDKPFRAKQIFLAIYAKYIDNFKDITTLSKDYRDTLAKEYSILTTSIIKKERSSDGSIKYLIKLSDNHTIETVLLLMKDEQLSDSGKVTKQAQYTVCVSTQVGCKVGCSFCLTAKSGFVRNLTTAEIVAQVLLIKKDNNFPPEKRINIVYMGMGEPLDNLDNLSKAIYIFKDADGLAISPKRQTISTSGISSKIKKLGEMKLDVQLAISLHAVDNKLREELIPMNKAYPIESIIEAVRNFPIKKRQKVLFEYLVIKDINDDVSSAKKLIKLLHGLKAKVNLIYFNPYPGTLYQRPTKESMGNFANYLIKHGVMATIRSSKGIDISAACGQLREQEIKKV